MNFKICKGETTYIYVIRDPFTGSVRYVGASTNPEYRHRQHFNDKTNIKKMEWMLAMREKGKDPVLEIVDKCPTAGRKSVENKWIKHYLDQGCDLLNVIYPGYDRRALFSS